MKKKQEEDKKKASKIIKTTLVYIEIKLASALPWLGYWALVRLDSEVCLNLGSLEAIV